MLGAALSRGGGNKDQTVPWQGEMAPAPLVAPGWSSGPLSRFSWDVPVPGAEVEAHQRHLCWRYLLGAQGVRLSVSPLSVCHASLTLSPLSVQPGVNQGLAGILSSPSSALGCWSRTGASTPGGTHAPLACSRLPLLTAIFVGLFFFFFSPNSAKLVFLLDCISYLIVDLPGFAPSSRP